jgi:hypothetical protein
LIVRVLSGKAAHGRFSARPVVRAEEAMTTGMLSIKGKLVLVALVLGLAIGRDDWRCILVGRGLFLAR